MARKFISIVLAALILTSFGACAKPADDPSKTGTPPADSQGTTDQNPVDGNIPAGDANLPNGSEVTPEAPADITPDAESNLPAE